MQSREVPESSASPAQEPCQELGGNLLVVLTARSELELEFSVIRVL